MAGTLTVAPRVALHWRSAPLLLAAAALLLFIVGLGQTALWDQDEAKYTEVARQIVQRGDPITLYINGEPWFVHPPLHPWLVAATGALFGFTEFTARIWTALFGAAGVVVTSLLGRRLYDARTGVAAGLILMTTMEYVILSRLVTFDVPLVLFILLSLYMVLVAMDAETGDPPAARRAYRWAFLWAGLATLTKGPIGLLLPAVILGAWWLWLGQWRSVLRRLPWEGLLLYVVVGLSWYAAEAVLHGTAFLRTTVGYYMFNRFFGVVENQPGPPYYYLPVLLLGGFPWSAFLPGAMVYHWRRRRDQRSLFLVLWVGLTLLFYSAAGTKLPNYILPIFPLAAVALARQWVAAQWEGDAQAGDLLRGSGILLVAVVGLFAVAAAVFGRTEFPEEFRFLTPYLILVLTLFLVGALVVAGLVFTRRLASGFAALLATALLALGVIVVLTVLVVEPLRPMKPLALLVRERRQPGDRFVAVGLDERASLIYYTGRNVLKVAPQPPALRRAICGPGRTFLAIHKGDYDGWARAAFADDLVVLAAKGDVVVLQSAGSLPCPSP